MKVTVGVSAHHVHLNKKDLETLFGHELTFMRSLNQIGQFASMELVTLKTEKGEIKNVRVLGPIRDYTQVEISKTDSFKLGLNPPVRSSGDLNDSEKITIIGEKGSIDLEQGVIIADRHIHMTKEESLKYGFKNNQKVKIKVDTIKGGILDNVRIRVADNSYYEMHLDTDDANAFMLKNGDEVTIIED